MSRSFPYRYLFEGTLSSCANRLLWAAAELRIPECMLTPSVNAYIKFLGVDMSQVLIPAGGFRSFGDFFARKLKPDARPCCRAPNSIASPCDGIVVGNGQIEHNVSAALVVKNRTYSVQDLIADPAVAYGLVGGGYCVIYLHPRDYHRIHIPMNAKLREVRHIAGTRYPMAPWAESFSNGAIGKNERVAFDLELNDDGPLCVLLMVAAFGVGNIESVHLPEAGRGQNTIRRVPCTARLQRGDEIGAFRLGSTVVLLWPPEVIQLDESCIPGARVLAGQQIGQMHIPQLSHKLRDGY